MRKIEDYLVATSDIFCERTDVRRGNWLAEKIGCYGTTSCME